MVIYGKIVDGKLVVAGQKIKIEKGWITNPTEEQLRAEGYKEIVYTEQPSYDYENEKLVERYTEISNEDNERITPIKEQILVSYDIVALTDEEHNEIIKAKIEEEENKITMRNYRNAIKGDEFALKKIDEVETNIATLRAKLR